MTRNVPKALPTPPIPIPITAGKNSSPNASIKQPRATKAKKYALPVITTFSDLKERMTEAGKRHLQPSAAK